ncbi:hypothetical protein [Lactobacillus sp. LL6]|uniref:hypothetical protein n=1 Tax=Lactobacillus sp. LL6 TaxID=2596827 RepID=UPI0011852882|nr:hypothetical protein [Lactobacillus sp. LL6]TSO26697.1 hypothetical protein FOD82_06445 [Lactobacillus sp. LL6]
MGIFLNQWIKVWYEIRKRSLAWIIILGLSIFLLKNNIPITSKIHLVNYLFDGVSFKEIELNMVRLPIFWLSYFYGISLILLDTFVQLNKTRAVVLRGMQVSAKKYNFSILCIMNLLCFLYSGIIFWIIMANDRKIIDYRLWLVMYLGTLFFIVVQNIFSKYNLILGLIIPLIFLVLTIYIPWQQNPLNSLMLARNSSVGLLAISTVLVEVIFYYLNDYGEKY